MKKLLNDNKFNNLDALSIHKMKVSYKRKSKYIFDILDRYINKKDLHIADFGCGPAYFLVDLNRNLNVSRLYGIDAMSEAIESAKTLISKHKIGYKTKLIHMNLVDDEIQVPVQSIDIAIASQLLSTLSLPIEVIIKIHKVMKPEGIFLVFDWIRFSLEDAFEIWRKKNHTSLQAYHNWLTFSRFDLKDYFQILTVGGFRINEIFEVPWYGDGKPLASGKCASILLITEPNH